MDELPSPTVLVQMGPEPAKKEGRKGKGKGKGKDKKAPERQKDVGLEGTLEKYERSGANRKELKDALRGDFKLGEKVKRQYKKNREAAFLLAKSEVLQTGEAGYIQLDEGESADTLVQDDILQNSGIGVARKRFNFALPYGPYKCAFTRNGQYLLNAGRKGHICFMHVDTMKIACELHVKETVRAVQPLHNNLMFAAAQKKHLYIYDSQGVEIHCLKSVRTPTHLEFLPYHFLLVCAGESAELNWRDISTGQEVSYVKTHLGPTSALRQNPRNGVVHLGHMKGLVTLWTPNVKEPVVKMPAHGGPITSLCVHGDYMLTAGADSYWKVWDLRKYESLGSHRSFGHAVSDLDVSQTGLVAVSSGCNFEAWKDVFRAAQPSKPYMKDAYYGKMIESVRFRPFEDVCGVGHTDGFGSLIIPGAGVANFDSFEVNPYEGAKQRKEREVKMLLEKLQPDSIMLDPSRIGSVNKEVVEKYMADRAKEQAEAAKEAKPKKKMRGKNKAGARLKRKHLQEGAEQRKKAKSRLEAEGKGEAGDDDEDDDDDDDDEEEEAGGNGEEGEAVRPMPKGTGAALSRFYGRRQRKT